MMIIGVCLVFVIPVKLPSPCFKPTQSKNLYCSLYSSGFGFVQFALHADALRAVADVGKTKFQGKKLKAEIALKKKISTERKCKCINFCFEVFGSIAEQKEACSFLISWISI